MKLGKQRTKSKGRIRLRPESTKCPEENESGWQSAECGRGQFRRRRGQAFAAALGRRLSREARRGKSRGRRVQVKQQRSPHWTVTASLHGTDRGPQPLPPSTQASSSSRLRLKSRQSRLSSLHELPAAAETRYHKPRWPNTTVTYPPAVPEAYV